MSGIEIAGLILGAIPVLLEVLDVYKSGLGRIGTAFRKHKYVEKLARALRLHNDTLESLISSVLISSGCQDPGISTSEVRMILNDPDVQDDVKIYLGAQSHTTLTEILQDCEEIFQELIRKIASFIPSVKGSIELTKIIERNELTEKGSLDVLARLKLAFSVQDIEAEVQKLDASIATLDRYLRITIGNRQLSGQQPSARSTVKLAKAIRKVRNQADDLFNAIAQGWSAACHPCHEAKLLLENRHAPCPSAQQTRSHHRSPANAFSVIFVGRASDNDHLWHETEVYVAEDNGDVDDMVGSSSKCPAVKIVLPATSSPPDTHTQDINDICSTITEAENKRNKIVFELTPNHHISRIAQAHKPFACYPTSSTITLHSLLHRPVSKQQKMPVLPWKLKMELTLTVASSAFQLLQTPWIKSTLSAGKIYFVIGKAEQKANLGKPFLSYSFDSQCAMTGSSGIVTTTREVLVELGILLLEIWHETTLEHRCSTQVLAISDRQARALDWLYDEMNPLPTSYHSAVHRCVTSLMIDGSRLPDWQDMTLWKAACSGIIEPLSKLTHL